MSDTVICTWFVADDDSDSTYFPQIGAQSNTPEAKSIYWRCVAVFYVSSLLVNKGRRHLFFTNTSLPIVDGVSFSDLFARLGVEVVTLPITFRLKRGAVEAWGNQFYILDILRWIAGQPGIARAIVLDSDCVWTRPVAGIEAAIDEHGALTYELDRSEHADDEPINGLTRAGMARFLATLGGPERPTTPYHGGEIVAATQATIRRIVADVDTAWAMTLAGGPDAPKEEAHFLSILYAKHGVDAGTANRFIRRIWTNLTHYNARPADRELAIWHLPSAKRFGFAALFRRIASADGRDIGDLGFDSALYERVFGVPRRTAAVMVPVLRYKLAEKGRKLLASVRRG